MPVETFNQYRMGDTYRLRSGRGSRSTWKTRTHLWRDYRRIDDTAVSATAKHVN